MTLHIGQIGCGPWGANILRDLLAIGVEVTVVARHDSSVARAEAGGAHRVVRDVADLPEIDGIVVTTQATDHFRAIMSVVDRGVPIYCEKPITTDSAHARALVDTAPDRIFVMHKWRYHPAIDKVRELVESGDLGRPTSFRATRHQWGTGHTDIDAIWTLVPHDCSIALHVLGELPEVRAAWGTQRDDHLVSLGAILGDGPWMRLDMSILAAERRRSFTVEGTEGSAMVSDRNYDLVTVRSKGSDAPHEIGVASTMPLLAELTAFVDHVRGGPPPMSSAADALLVVERCETIRKLAVDSARA